MKFIWIAFFIFSSFSALTQESYDFAQILPLGEKSIPTVASDHFGSYLSENGESSYEINAEGIWIVSTLFSSISRETIRESSKYHVREGYIFGVVQDDSLPCVLEDERYYFGMRNREQLIGGESGNQLTKMGANNYVINYYENGGFTPSLLTFSGKLLNIQHFDYETGTTVFASIIDISTKTKDGIECVRLNPTEKEWEELPTTSIFGKKYTYFRP